MKTLLKSLTYFLTIIFAATSAYAIQATSKARIFKPITIEETTKMDFGEFAAGSGGTINHGGSTTGDIVLLGGAPSPSIFLVKGNPNSEYDISIDNNVTLNRVGGGSSMSADLSIAGGGNSGDLNGSGQDNFNVNGILTVSDNQQVGLYKGYYNVTVIYDD